MKKEIPLNEVISVTTGILVADFNKMQKFMEWYAGCSLSMVGMLALAEKMEIEIHLQHPGLKDIDVSNVNESNWQEWLTEQEVKFGKTLVIDRGD